MEGLVVKGAFGGVYEGRRILVTGHRGFKGSWLALWLESLGAEVLGYSLGSPSQPSHWELLAPDTEERIGDLRDRTLLETTCQTFRPELIFHLAARAIVRDAYEDPVECFSSNVMGTVTLLDVARHLGDLRACVVVTSDKCYENAEGPWPYRESDPMGGRDPYSASKGCAELVTASYRRSFFEKGTCLLATARSGNVVGGGDWGRARLLPDLVRATTEGETLAIRHPEGVRPWLHVLDGLAAYLRLGQRLLEGEVEAARAWNFGPSGDPLSVAELLEEARRHWPALRYEFRPETATFAEAGLLQLDSTLARTRLGWRPLWEGREGVRRAIEWYRRHAEARVLSSREQLEAYVSEAGTKGLPWLR